MEYSLQFLKFSEFHGGIGFRYCSGIECTFHFGHPLNY